MKTKIAGDLTPKAYGIRAKKTAGHPLRAMAG